jgi:hypothetical protein
MHADAQLQTVRLGAQSLLNGDGAAQCLHGAGEGNEKAIAGSFEQSAAIRGARRYPNTVSMGFGRAVRTGASSARDADAGSGGQGLGIFPTDPLDAMEAGQCARIASFAAVIMFRRSLGDTPRSVAPHKLSTTCLVS